MLIVRTSQRKRELRGAPSRTGAPENNSRVALNESTNWQDSPSAITIFSRWPVCRSYAWVTPRFSSARSPSSRDERWNAVSVRSFVTYDALMKFADSRVTVSQSYPDERRGSSTNYGVLRHHCSVGSTVVRGNELTSARPY